MTPLTFDKKPKVRDAAKLMIVGHFSTGNSHLLTASLQKLVIGRSADVAAKPYAAQAFAAAAGTNHVTIQTQPPTSVAAGTTFSMAIAIVDNITNKTDTSFNGSVTIALTSNPSGATLFGTLTVNAVKGLATFSGLSLDKVGTGYTIEASAIDVAAGTTRAVKVTPGAVAKLVLSTLPPTNVTAGVGFGLVVKAYDKFDNLATNFTGSITAATVTKPSGAIAPSGTLTVNAVGGIATFTNIMLKTAGDYRLSLAGSTAPKITTDIIHVDPGAATSLAFVDQPPKTIVAGADFGLTVKVLDVYGNTVVGFNGNLTATIAKNVGGSTLGGTATVAVINGIASFTGLKLNKVGTGYTLQVAGVGSKPTATGTINVTPGAMTQLVVTTQPSSSVKAGSKFKVVVTAQDAQGNKATSFKGAVSIALTNYPDGATLGGTLVRNAVSGVVTFDNLTLTKASTSYSLTAFADGVSASTMGFDVVAIQAAQLVLTTPPPASVPMGSGFGLVVKALDQYGNQATGYNSNATVKLLSNTAKATLGGTLTTPFVNGLATFTNLSLNKIASGYTLQVRSGSLPSLTTSAISAFGQVTLSTGDADPFDSALLTGVVINSTLPTIVTFTDPFGNEFSVSPTSVDASGVRFPVPIYMDLTTGNVTSGVYSVRLQQQTSSGMVSYPADRQLHVADLPQTGFAPGSVLKAYLTQMQSFYDDLLTDWQQIKNQASPFADVSSLTSTIKSSKEQIANLLTQLSPLLNGEVAGIELSPTVSMTPAALVDIDRVLLEQLTRISSTSVASSFAASGTGGSSALMQLAEASGNQTADGRVHTFFDYVKAIDRAYKQMLPSFKVIKDAAVTGAAIGGTIGGGPLGGLEAAVLVNNISNATLLVAGVGFRFAADMIRSDGTITNQQIADLVKYAVSLRKEIYVGSDVKEITAWGAGKIIDQILELRGRGDLAGAFGTLTSIWDTGNYFYDEINQKIIPHYTQIVQNYLTPPVLSISPQTLTFTVPLGGTPPASQKITITNLGDVRSTMDFTASSSLSSLSISGSGSVPGGSSTVIDVSVITWNLKKGTYTGTLQVDSKAAGSTIPVNVTINVIEPEITIFPSGLWFTVTKGQSEQSQNMAIMNTDTNGTVLTYSAFSLYGYVQLSGNHTQLGSNQYDFLTVTTRATNLTPNTYTDYIYVFDSNSNGTNYKYIPVTIIVQAPPLPVIGGTTDVNFTATPNGPSPASQSVTISNVGAAGSVLNWAASMPNNRYSWSGGVSPLNAGYYTTATLSVNTYGLPAGQYTDYISIYSTDDPRVVVKTIAVHITITGQSLPTWGAFQQGGSTPSDQTYSISAAQMNIRFWMQPFTAADRYIVSDNFGNVYIDVQFNTQDNDPSAPLWQQHPQYIDFIKPANVTSLRVRVIPTSDSTVWWYKGVLQGQQWY